MEIKVAPPTKDGTQNPKENNDGLEADTQR